MKIAIINRGIPGSGKSTFNNIIKEMCMQNAITIATHSTDNYFMKDGKYIFDNSQLYYFHKKNLKSFSYSVSKGTNIVIVDNTNINCSEYKKYISVAKNNNYTIISVVFYPDTIEAHISRQVHNVPINVLENMRKRFIDAIKTIGCDKEYIIYPKDFLIDYLKKICKEIINK